ncbi:MAG: hypothetical protein PWR10_1111 [Halanaerobiales bacterium]|nr:hypothetical protein [Halanaerobiales bacterium]
MNSRERIKYALEETEILKFPGNLISTFKPTTLHYYVLAEPAYLEVFKNEGPETKIREGRITWEKPKLLTPGYLLQMEGFSEEARKALQILARQHPDMAGLLYRMRYKKESQRTVTVSRTIKDTFRRLKDELKEKDDFLTVIIKGVDELWDVSLMKFIQELIVKSAYQSQFPYYTNLGMLRMDEGGYAVVTRNLEGLPIAARDEIEQMFDQVKRGELDPAKLKQELDRWGVFPAYEDRFFDLFRKE